MERLRCDSIYFLGEQGVDVYLADEVDALLADLRKKLNRLEVLKERILYLDDQFQDGIKYDEQSNHYVLVWTRREIEYAKKEAIEIKARLFGEDIEEQDGNNQ